MVDYPAEIKRLEDELRNTPYNKATERHFGVVKAKMAKLRGKIEKQASKKTKGGGFAVKKTGDASVALLGFPSVGKSTLLNRLTGAKSAVAAYAFTTLDVIPGVMKYNQAKIQILDVPGIISGAASGKGRGREVLSIVRNSDLILILIDALHPEHYDAILKEVYDAGVRINQKPPDIVIKKRARGGLSIGATVPLELDEKTIVDICKTFRINNGDVLIRTHVNIDTFIDALEANRVYIPAISIITKIDLLDKFQQKTLIERINPDLVVSAEKGTGIDELRELIFNKLRFIRLYLKEIGKNPDLDEPLVMVKGTTVREVCRKIHRDFEKKFKYVKVWGKSAKFPGQLFKDLNKKLEDGDIVEIHIS